MKEYRVRLYLDNDYVDLESTNSRESAELLESWYLYHKQFFNGKFIIVTEEVEI